MAREDIRASCALMIVYRLGNLTIDNFTPRVANDTVGRPGQRPGLSASETIPLGKKAQGIEVERLQPPLQIFPDDVDQGRIPGHVAIAPADEAGEVDLGSLELWASARGTGTIHPFTQALLEAVVQVNAKGSTP